MKFFIDENVSVGVALPLRNIYFGHQFATADEMALCGVDDLDLIPEVAARGFDALITKDFNQLKDPVEREALRDAELHWIGHRMKSHAGLLGLTLETAALTAGLAYVLEDLRDVPHAYRLKGVPAEPGQRLHVLEL